VRKYFIRFITGIALQSFFLSLPSIILAQSPTTIEFGCGIDPAEQILESRTLAKSVANPEDPNWRAKGDLKRKYHLPAANADIPYRLYMPVSWDGKSRLPMVVFLHGAMSCLSWDNIRKMPVFMTEGTGAKPSLAGSGGFVVASIDDEKKRTGIFNSLLIWPFVNLIIYTGIILMGI
jgi:hypothetical protein